MAKSKSKTVFSCQNCGAQRPKWQGQCSDCGSWNTFIEETISPSTESSVQRGWALGATQRSTSGTSVGSVSLQKKSRVLDEEFCETRLDRYPTGLSEFDRVLGGGLVPGSFVLVGGDPGIGKSTLLLQTAGGLSKAEKGVLYVSSEESIEQTGLRAQRLGITAKRVEVASENNLDVILDLAQSKKPVVLIVDSIQTIYLPGLDSAPGSVSQVRECAGRLMVLAKNHKITVVLVGHVTKDGSLAGPKVLEHMVDTVLAFEGDLTQQFRLLRSLKNRFGAAQELGVFRMDAEGLKEVLNPSELFLEERSESAVGSAIFSSMEGSRPLLCEIQALTNPSPMVNPRRTAIGCDLNRIHLLVAVLDKHMGQALAPCDVYVNVVGGLKLSEPACDLAIAAALLSSEASEKLGTKTIFFGEIGLTGEVRAVTFAEARLREAHKLGFHHYVIPLSNKKHIESILKSLKSPKGTPADVTWVSHVRDLQQLVSRRAQARPQPKAAGRFVDV